MTLQQQIRANQIRSAIMMVAFMALILILGLATVLVAGIEGGTVVVAIGLIYMLVLLRQANSVVRRESGAQPASRQTHPELFHAVEAASVAAGLDRTPDVFVMDEAAPNAFAAGMRTEDAWVAATTGLLRIMDRDELEAVMAHEIAHVRNQDVRLMTMAGVLSAGVMFMADIGLRMMWTSGRGRGRSHGGGQSGGGAGILVLVAIVMIILAPIVATVLRMSLSRKREYLADATAVEITGSPHGMAGALAKLGRDTTPMARVSHSVSHMYIEPPLRDDRGLRGSLGGLLDTHPPLHDRIRRVCETHGIDPSLYAVPEL